MQDGDSQNSVTDEPLVAPIELVVPYDGDTGTDTAAAALVRLGNLGSLPDFSSDERAAFHPHGRLVCASGCALHNHPTPELSPAEFKRLLADFALGPIDESNRGLETLLFYGRQTQALLNSEGPAPLDDEREAFLRRELARTHALVSFRVVDEHGVVRTHMPPTRVPFDRRHVFTMETRGLPPLVTSGTVKRVGLDHLWTRL